jgi:hypothetical protein
MCYLKIGKFITEVIRLGDTYDKRRRKIEGYLDKHIIEANRDLDEQFYEGNEDLTDADLYNMGDSTPIINEGINEKNEKNQT